MRCDKLDFEERELGRKKPRVVCKIVGGTDEQHGERKGPGRPKVSREKKERYTLTLFPSKYNAAQKIANENGKSLSEVVDDFLDIYVKKNGNVLK